ncbi:MAG TPA: MaoC family dehydratase [Pseudogracilibacillus sp.]|nr:MaoC family dehydratase [Pseudogracilibacillus sp.]
MNRTHFSMQITEALINHYAQTSRDYNPIHLDKQAALSLGLPEKIAHGMLTLALSARLLTPILAKGLCVERFKIKMLQPVYVNDTIEVTIQAVDETNHSYRLIGFKQTSLKKVLQGKIKLNHLS